MPWSQQLKGYASVEREPPSQAALDSVGFDAARDGVDYYRHYFDVRDRASENFARFSLCGQYRYYLSLKIEPKPSSDQHIEALKFIMLNPSTATHRTLDPTVRRCVGFAERVGATRLIVSNLFALRSTDPSKLRTHAAPIQQPALFDIAAHMLARHALNPGISVCAWGTHGNLYGRGCRVETDLREAGEDLYCLGVNKDGTPKHPLYLRKDTPLQRWRNGLLSGPDRALRKTHFQLWRDTL